ncbi:MAG: hypothetical protein HDQ98_14055 [Lachnospiraceae bacterium]|nr:hypothetical protein [Lachnospiraceae bacterium]
MYHYTIAQWLLFFFFYCFFGWCFESSYVSGKQGRFVNRGFMYGPFLPIYGSGAIMMLVVSSPFQDHLIAIYFAGLVGATVLEYVTGMAMEALFHVRYWDYSNQRFQYKGHICLSSSVAWGFLTLFLTQLLHKPVEQFICGFSDRVSAVLASVIGAIALIDFVLSFKAAFELRDLLAKLEKAREEVEKAKEELARWQKRRDVEIALRAQESEQKKEQRKEQLEAWLAERREQAAAIADNARRKLQTRRILRGNPGMVSGRFKGSMEELKHLVLRIRKNESDKSDADQKE